MGWRERVEDEQTELSVRAQTLDRFLDTPAAMSAVTPEHKALLQVQLSLIQAYDKVLRMRLNLTVPMEEGDVTGDYVRPTVDPEHL